MIAEFDVNRAPASAHLISVHVEFVAPGRFSQTKLHNLTQIRLFPEWPKQVHILLQHRGNTEQVTLNSASWMALRESWDVPQFLRDCHHMRLDQAIDVQLEPVREVARYRPSIS